MKKTKIVEFEGKSYTVSELTIKQIWEFGTTVKGLMAKEKTPARKADIAKMEDLRKKLVLEKDVALRAPMEEEYKTLQATEKAAQNASNMEFLEFVKKWMPEAIGMEWGVAYEKAPSEIEGLWEKFLEVNKSFLSILASVGLKDAGRQMIKTFQLNLSKSYAGLLEADTPES